MNKTPLSSLLGAKREQQLRVALCGIGLQAYWEQFEGLRSQLEGYLQQLADSLAEPGIEVMQLDLVDSVERARETGANAGAAMRTCCCSMSQPTLYQALCFLLCSDAACQSSCSISSRRRGDRLRRVQSPAGSPRDDRPLACVLLRVSRARDCERLRPSAGSHSTRSRACSGTSRHLGEIREWIAAAKVVANCCAKTGWGFWATTTAACWTLRPTSLRSRSPSAAISRYSRSTS